MCIRDRSRAEPWPVLRQLRGPRGLAGAQRGAALWLARARREPAAALHIGARSACLTCPVSWNMQNSGDLSGTLRLLRDGSPHTRAQLAQITGQARSTVAARVEQLLESGLVSPSGDAVSTGGRPPVETASPDGLTRPDSRSCSTRAATVDRAWPVIWASCARVCGLPSLSSRKVPLKSPEFCMFHDTGQVKHAERAPRCLLKAT